MDGFSYPVEAGRTNMVSVEFTRAANATGYDANDVVAPAAGGLVEMANVARAPAGSGYIVGIACETNKKSITPRLKIHLYNASDPTLSADGANWQDKYVDASKRVAAYSLAALATAADTTNSDMSSVEDFSMRIPFECAAGATSLYIGMENLDAFTPASGQKFTWKLWVELN